MFTRQHNAEKVVDGCDFKNFQIMDLKLFYNITYDTGSSKSPADHVFTYWMRAHNLKPNSDISYKNNGI